jgi:hypothetical protein
MTLSKRFKFTERMDLQFRAEAMRVQSHEFRRSEHRVEAQHSGRSPARVTRD